MRIGKHLAAFLLLLFSFNVAYGCSCAGAGPPCQYFGSTDAIFLGRVVGSAQRKTYVDEKGNKTVYDVGTIRFLVQENFKGAPGYEIEIHSGSGGGDCGYWFLRNESYVVYAHRSSEDNKLYTGICTRTAHVTQAEEDLQYLRGVANAKPGATLSGQLRRIIGDPYHGPFKEGPKMAGVKIVVTGEGKTIETVTNDAGEFRLTGLPPGDYDAYPELPSDLGFVSGRDKKDNFGRVIGRDPIRLTDRSCAQMNFTVQFSGVISGKVLDSDGNPAKEVQLNIVPEEDGDKHWWTWTDEEGRFEFKMVQPGSYLLGFNLKWVPDKEDPYPKTFYPGVKTRSEASLITIGEGEKLMGYDMTLPPRLSEREVKVTVVWPNGSPAMNVNVDYEISEGTTLGQRVQTDNKGVTVLKLFDNYHYIIYGGAERNGKDVHSTPIEIVVDKNVEPLKLVLDKEGYGYSEKEDFKRKSKTP